MNNYDLTTAILDKAESGDYMNLMLVSHMFQAITQSFELDPIGKVKHLLNNLLRQTHDTKAQKYQRITMFLETVVDHYYDALLDPVVSDRIFRMMCSEMVSHYTQCYGSLREDDRNTLRIRNVIARRLRLTNAKKETMANLKKFAGIKKGDGHFAFAGWKKATLVEYVSM